MINIDALMSHIIEPNYKENRIFFVNLKQNHVPLLKNMWHFLFVGEKTQMENMRLHRMILGDMTTMTRGQKKKQIENSGSKSVTVCHGICQTVDAL